MAQLRPRYTEAIRRQLTRPSPFITASDTTLKFENVSYGQLHVLSAVPAQNAAADQTSSPELYVEATPIMQGRGVVKRFLNEEAHIVPVHAEWFCPTEVHNFERTLTSDAENYMNFRNSVVAKYIRDPEKRLTIEDCVGMESGFSDEDINRIFRFLESWGIINYCADELPPDHEFLRSGSCSVEDVDGVVQLPSAGLNSVECLIKLEKPKCSIKESNGDDMSELEYRIMEKLAEHRCKCCSKPLSKEYYRSVKEDNVMLCLDCYHDGRFVVGHSSNDFARLENTKEDQNRADVDTWTDEETLLLLEAVEMYDDDWPEIADHVGSKTKAQCILHFLRMPLDSCVLSNLDIPTSDGKSEGISVQDTDSCSRLPFSNTENPVMALVAFLGSFFGPKVAAACAQAALIVLSNPSDERIPEDGSDDETRNPGQDGDISPIDGEMVKSAVKAGLIAAAIKAKLVADQEEREIQRYAAILTAVQLKRLELKLTQLVEADNIFLKQCEQMEKTRQKLVVEQDIYKTKYQSLLMGNANCIATSNRLMPASFGSGNQMNHSNYYIPAYQSPSTGNANPAATSNRLDDLMSELPTSFTALLTGSEDQLNHSNQFMPAYQSPATGYANAAALSNRTVNLMSASPTSFTSLLTGSGNQMNYSNHYTPAYQYPSTRPTSFTGLLTDSGNQMNYLNPYMPAYQSPSTGYANAMAASNRPANIMSASPTSFTGLLTGSGYRLPSSSTQPSSAFQARNGMFDPQVTGQHAYGYPLSGFIPGTSSQFS